MTKIENGERNLSFFADFCKIPSIFRHLRTHCERTLKKIEKVLYKEENSAQKSKKV
jgi:hypothetical protein